jgi:hypothetical protein
MSPDELHDLLAAPELVVVDLVDHTLTALRLALLAEHPLIDDDLNAHDDAPVQRRARALLRQAERLRLVLAAYRKQVGRALTKWDQPDLPF